MTTHYRVLYVTDTLANGGAERQLALLLQYLRQDWQKRVYSLSDGPFAQVLRDDGVELDLRLRRWRYDLRPLLGIWRSIRTWRPHIVHCLGWMGLAAALPICRLLGIPTIGSIRAGAPNAHRVRGYAQTAVTRSATRVIANSQAGLKTWRVLPGKGRVVYNGFDLRRMPVDEPRLRSATRPFTVIMAARMTAGKDFGTFLMAARRVLDLATMQSWRFVVLGDGPSRSRVMKRAQDLGLHDWVVFPQPTLEVLPNVCQADVGVLMTESSLHAEGCSNTLLEYMACGLPVVCSDGGGNREVVLDGETGFVIRPGDPEQLADRLLWLYSHRETIAQMGAAGQERLRRDFQVEQMVNRTIDVYREMLMAE